MPTPLDRAMNSKVFNHMYLWTLTNKSLQNLFLGIHFFIWNNSKTSKHLAKVISGFTGMISAAAVWAIWGNDMFPAEQDPTGGRIRNPVDLSLALILKKTLKTGQPMS